MSNEKLDEIKNGLSEINQSINEKVQISNDLIINMKQNLESLQSSLVETNKYIEVLNENIEDDNNIFFLGAGNQENKNKLKEQNKIKFEIEEKIKEIEDTISMEDDKKNFLVSIYDSIHIYNDKISALNNCENEDINLGNNKSKLLDMLILCQKFSKIDHERCYIELSKVIEEVEKWEEK